MKKLLTLAATFGFAAAVQAGPMSITTPYGVTSFFSALGASNLAVTSVYTPGAPVSSANDLIGQNVAFTDVGQGTWGQLVPLIGSPGGYGTTWKLDFKYTLSGVATFQDGPTKGFLPPDGNLDGYGSGFPFPTGPDGEIDPWDAIIPNYTFGQFEFFYVDIGSNVSTKVLQMNMTGFSSSGPNAVIRSVVDYDSWYAGGNALVDNMFKDQGTNKTFYELSQEMPPKQVDFRFDFNVDPNYVPTCKNGCTTLERTTDLNITGRFSVSEPTSLAVLGLGLIALVARRRKAA